MRERGFFALATACLYTFLLAALLSIHSHAQSFQPTRTAFATSVFVEGQAMYVVGGLQSSTGDVMGQFFSLDFSTSWNMTSPLFKSLPNGYWDYSAGGTLSKDKKDWLIFSNQSIFNYNFASSTWSILYDKQSELWGRGGLSAVTDPNTGWIFVPNGRKRLNDTNTSLLVVFPEDIALKTWHFGTMEPRLVNMTFYSLAWAPMLNGFLVFGGWDASSNITLGSLYTYSVSRGWQAFDATGDIPSARSGSCLVPAYSGSKMVLFGGEGSYDKTMSHGPALNDIYILDVAERIWTRGPNVGTGGARFGHVCAVSGDYFISWGGTVDTTSPISDTVIYNLKSSTWTSRYEYLSSPGPPPPPDSLSTAAVTGIAVGALVVVVLFLVGAFVWRRKRRAQPMNSSANIPYSPAVNPSNEPPIYSPSAIFRLRKTEQPGPTPDAYQCAAAIPMPQLNQQLAAYPPDMSAQPYHASIFVPPSSMSPSQLSDRAGYSEPQPYQPGPFVPPSSMSPSQLSDRAGHSEPQPYQPGPFVPPSSMSPFQLRYSEPQPCQQGPFVPPSSMSPFQLNDRAGHSEPQPCQPGPFLPPSSMSPSQLSNRAGHSEPQPYQPGPFVPPSSMSPSQLSERVGHSEPQPYQPGPFVPPSSMSPSQLSDRAGHSEPQPYQPSIFVPPSSMSPSQLSDRAGHSEAQQHQPSIFIPPSSVSPSQLSDRVGHSEPQPYSPSIFVPPSSMSPSQLSDIAGHSEPWTPESHLRTVQGGGYL